MDNLTHSLLGLAAAKSGLDKLSPGATTMCVLAANAPDADIVILLFGDRWDFLQHHRGITHALVGVVSLAILLPLLFFLVDRIISRIRNRAPQVRLKGLLVASIIVTLTHPILDWTNSYGIRPFLPWDSHWIYGDLVFIVDPFIWLVLGTGCFLLTRRKRFNQVVWALVAAAITLLLIVAPRGGGLPHMWVIRSLWLLMLVFAIVLYVKRVGERFRWKIGVTAILAVCLYWSLLMLAHARALTRGNEIAAQILPREESLSRLAAMPTLANPFNWDCVFETDKATYRFNLSLSSNVPVSRVVRFEKPAGNLETALTRVANDRRTKVFLGFARFPVARLSNEDCAAQTLVQLADLRYTEPGTGRGAFTLDLPTDCAQPLTLNR